MLLHQPRDILYSIISFLEYTPDTARLGRACKTLDRIPNWYERSWHRQPHQLHRIENTNYFYFEDGRITRSAYCKHTDRRVMLVKHLRSKPRVLVNMVEERGAIAGHVSSQDGETWYTEMKWNGQREVDQLLFYCVEKKKRQCIHFSEAYGGTIAVNEVDEQQRTTTWFYFTKGTRKLVVWYEMVNSPESDCISIFRKKESIEEKWWGVSRQYKAAPSTFDREQLEESKLPVLDDYDMLIFHTS
jgi:hypothetical protein